MSSIETKPLGRIDPSTVSPSLPVAPSAPQPQGSSAPIVAADARAAQAIQGRTNPTPQLATPASTGSCARKPAAADRQRHIVVSHPFAPNNGRGTSFEVLDLTADGELSRPGRTFKLGTAGSGNIAFTPDGQVGLAALDDGKIGVFRLDAQGNPTVVYGDDKNPAFSGHFYAGKIIMEPSGQHALVVDPEWRESGGGIYRVGIGCDGTLTDEGLVLGAKLPGGLVLNGNRAILAADDVGKVAPAPQPKTDGKPDSVHLMEWSQSPTKIAGTEAFGYNEPTVSSGALTSDGKTYLVGDSNGFSLAGNNVATVAVGENGLHALNRIPIQDPQAIATSPFGDVALVASTLGSEIYVLDKAGPNGAWRMRGPLQHKGDQPMLPTDFATIDQGKLQGHVFVSEASGLRHLAFQKDGSVVDFGSFTLGKPNEVESVPGAIGVTK